LEEIAEWRSRGVEEWRSVGEDEWRSGRCSYTTPLPLYSPTPLLPHVFSQGRERTCGYEGREGRA
jgi:hypothetical protein